MLFRSAVSADPDGYFARMPVVNRAMRGLMITEPARPNLLRYPGALLTDSSDSVCSATDAEGNAAAATGLAIGIPLVNSRDSSGAETITWVPVLEELRAAADAECPMRGPFRLTPYVGAMDTCGALTSDPVVDRGLAAVRVNYPYQAAALSAFVPAQATDVYPNPPNLASVISANDSGVSETNTTPGGLIDDGGVGPYAGPYGLGRQLAFAGRVVRPFRRLISVQAIYRREAVE